MMRKALNILTFIIGASTGLAGQASQLRAYEFEQADSLMRQEKRPMVAFIHTEWCRFCQNMKHTTFKNEAVAEKLNAGYYFVPFDAETLRPVEFNGQVFQYRPNGRQTGVHALAEALGAVNGKLSYPTLVIINQAYEIVFQYDAFLSAKALLAVLKELEFQN